MVPKVMQKFILIGLGGFFSPQGFMFKVNCLLRTQINSGLFFHNNFQELSVILLDFKSACIFGNLILWRRKIQSKRPRNLISVR